MSGFHDLRTSFLLRPFQYGWRVATRFEARHGVLRSLVAGVLFMIGGSVLMGSIMGMLFGVPAFVFGLLLVLRGLY